jgi:hypothetical protein
VLLHGGLYYCHSLAHVKKNLLAFTERGCPFINAIGEHDKTDERLRMLAVRHKAAIDDYLVSIVHLAGLHDPESIINELGILIDGAIVAAMVSRRPEVALFAKSAFAVLLREHTDGRSLDRRPF